MRRQRPRFNIGFNGLNGKDRSCDNGRPKVLDPSIPGTEASLLKSSLQQMIVGQDEAIARIVDIYQMHIIGMISPNRPVGNFLFLGPTGSGKTRIVEAVAETLVGTANAVLKVDCGEFQHSHEIAKLIGSPPGYLGHRETHPLLSQETLNQYHTERVKLSFLLFDEIEKASDSLWNLLLGILDKAKLTLGDNRRVDFSRTMIFLTSNLGANEMKSLLNPKMGFRTGQAISIATEAKVKRSGLEAARRKFTPEFMNRLDKVVVFNTLGKDELCQILDIELDMVQLRIFKAFPEKKFAFSVSLPAKEFILNAGNDKRYGARHIKRAIEQLIVYPISNLIASNQVCGGDAIKVELDPDQDKLLFILEAEGLTPMTIHDLFENRQFKKVANNG